MSAIPIKLSDQGKGASCMTKIESGTFSGASPFCSLYTVFGALTTVRSFLTDLLREFNKADSQRERSQLGLQ